MKKLRMADESNGYKQKIMCLHFMLYSDFDTLEHLELDSSTIRDVDLNPLISTIQV